jgi:uncharacterized phage protein gp47/JayE
MQLSFQNFSTMVETMAAAVQGAAVQLLDLTVGSVLRAILEANASLALWQQWLVLQALQATRLATSSGADCDSFGADFGFTRLPAVSASGVVLFGRFAPVLSAFIPVGTMVMTGGGTTQFTVVGDPANLAFSISQNGFLLGAGIGTITLPATAVTPGKGGNVQAGSVNQLGSAIPGVDTVINPVAFSGGVDAESDSAYRIRFGNYLASLSRATSSAINQAIAGVQQGLSSIVSENIDQTGAVQLGHFVVTVDDGTGNPPLSLIQTVQQAVDAVRPLSTSFAVQGPVVVLANVSMSLMLQPIAVRASVVPIVNSALTAYIDLLPVGSTLSYSRLAQIAYDAAPSIMNVTNISLNEASSDLIPPLFGVVRSGAILVS